MDCYLHHIHSPLVTLFSLLLRKGQKKMPFLKQRLSLSLSTFYAQKTERRRGIFFYFLTKKQKPTFLLPENTKIVFGFVAIGNPKQGFSCNFKHEPSIADTAKALIPLVREMRKHGIRLRSTINEEATSTRRAITHEETQ